MQFSYKIEHPIIHWNVVFWVWMSYNRRTMHCDVDRITVLSWSRLTPEHSTVPCVCVADGTCGPCYWSPVRDTPWLYSSLCVSHQSPSSRVPLLLTAQWERLWSKVLGCVGTYSERHWRLQIWNKETESNLQWYNDIYYTPEWELKYDSMQLVTSWPEKLRFTVECIIDWVSSPSSTHISSCGSSTSRDQSVGVFTSHIVRYGL